MGMAGARTISDKATANYQRMAEQCRRRADLSADAADKAYWLHISEIWFNAAQQRGGANPKPIDHSSLM